MYIDSIYILYVTRFRDRSQIERIEDAGGRSRDNGVDPPGRYFNCYDVINMAVAVVSRGRSRARTKTSLTLSR